MNELLLTYLSRYFLTYARASVLRDRYTLCRLQYTYCWQRATISLTSIVTNTEHLFGALFLFLEIAQGALSKSLSWMDGA